jgi:hypothetical protein
VSELFTNVSQREVSSLGVSGLADRDRTSSGAVNVHRAAAFFRGNARVLAVKRVRYAAIEQESRGS